MNGAWVSVTPWHSMPRDIPETMRELRYGVMRAGNMEQLVSPCQARTAGCQASTARPPQLAPLLVDAGPGVVRHRGPPVDRPASPETRRRSCICTDHQLPARCRCDHAALAPLRVWHVCMHCVHASTPCAPCPHRLLSAACPGGTVT